MPEFTSADLYEPKCYDTRDNVEYEEMIFAKDGSIISFWYCAPMENGHILAEHLKVFDCKVLFKSGECMSFGEMEKDVIDDWIQDEAYDWIKDNYQIWKN